MDTNSTGAGPVSREDYITRAAAVYEGEGGLHLKQARYCAAMLADDAADGLMGDMTPEEAAREDMSSWNNDGE